MASPKTASFSPPAIELARLAKALGHPARIEILQILARKKGCICGDLVEELPLSQATVSQHLKALKEAGIIKGEIDGPKICYCIDTENWQACIKTLGIFFSEITCPPDCCT